MPSSTRIAFTTVDVEVDYSQFTVEASAERCDPDDWQSDFSVGLVKGCGNGSSVLTTMRQWGTVPVMVELWDGAPAVAPEWGDAVEAHLSVPDELRVMGWAGESLAVVDFVPPGEYRLRYLIKDAERAGDADEPPYPESYLVQLWPSTFLPPAVIARETPMGRYWQAATQMYFTKPWEHTTSDHERIVSAIDALLAADPDSAQKIRDGRHEFFLAILPLVPWAPMGEERDSLQSLIVERALR
jgi:hypothetical protein